MAPGGVVLEPEAGFGEVVEAAKEYLARSKNLKIGALFTVSLLHQEGLEGMADGLELLANWLDNYWDSVHPPAASRLFVLAWLGSDAVSPALRLVPLTEAYGSGVIPTSNQGHRLAEYALWSRSAGKDAPAVGDKKEKEEADAIINGFSQGFAESSRQWYRDQQKALLRCEAALRAFDVTANTRYDQKARQKAGYASQYEKAGAGDPKGPLATAFKALEAPLRDLLERKPPEPGEREEVAAAEGSSAVTAPGETNASGTRDPRTPEEAAQVLRVALRILRRADPGNPAAYLMARGWRWGELRTDSETIPPKLLEAPATAERTRLKTLFLDQKWPELFEAVEEIMATPVGRGWLDLQRYAIVAASRLGAEYRPVVQALEGALSGLLKDFPNLAHASLMDDLPGTSSDTLAWLESAGYLKGGAAAPRQVADSDTDPERAVREAAFSRAAQIAQGGDAEGAVSLLLERSRHERSERARFITKAEAAGIMVGNGMNAVARHILDELDKAIVAHKLEEWEAGEVVARPLGLLYRCLAANDPARAKLHERLARLDPLLAMRVAADGNRPASAAPARPPSAPAPAAAPAPEDASG